MVKDNIHKEEITPVSREAMWAQSCKREVEIAREFKKTYDFMIDPNPPPTRDLEATITAKYYAKKQWTVRPKTIPKLVDFALEANKEVTFINELAATNHRVRLESSRAKPNPCFSTTNSKYGAGVEPFDVYSAQGPRTDSTDATNPRKLGVPLVELWGIGPSVDTMIGRDRTGTLKTVNSVRF